MYLQIIRCFILLGLLFPALALAVNISYPGTYSGTFSGGDSGNWTVTISSTGAMSGSGYSTIDGQSMTITGQAQPDGSLTFGNVSTGASFTGTVNLVTGAVSGTWSNFYEGTSGTINGAVTPNSQTVSFGLAPVVAVGGTATVSATATSGLAVSFSSSTPNICTVSGSTVTGIAAGSCIITASQAGNAFYLAAPSVASSITVSLPTLSVDTTSGTGSGTVKSDDGSINCGATCSSTYNVGDFVYLTANPDSGYAFSGWDGACTGTGGCPVTMDASKEVTATFDTAPFIVGTTGSNEGLITDPIATVTSTITFNSADVGQTGSVFVTALVPESFVNPLVARPSANRSFKATAQMAAENLDPLVLAQLTPSGWQQVENGQLIAYAAGVLGDQLAAQTLLTNADTASLAGSQFCVGYGLGTDDASASSEMTSAERMQLIGIVPDQDADNINTRTCNVTLPIPDASVFAYAEAIYSDLFPGTAMSSGQYQQYNYRYYPATGNYLAVGDDNVIYLYGPAWPAFPPTSVGSVEYFRSVITGWENTLSP